MPQIFLVRHGQASFGADDYDELSPLGAQQARRLGDWFGQCGRRVERLHRGSLRRHRQTAEHFMEALPAALRPADQAFVDRGFDEYDADAILLAAQPEVRSLAELRAWVERQPHPRRAFQQLFADAMARWISGRHDADYAESWAAFRERCTGALQRSIERAGEAKTLVVMTSGGPISAICQQVLQLSDTMACELCYGLANSSVTSVYARNGRLSLGQLNAIGHIEADSTLISYR